MINNDLGVQRVGFKRTIFVGDIHGCFDELMELLDKVSFDASCDRLVSLGDLMHKGNKSAEVIRFFMDNGYEAIMGNHDYYFMQILAKEREETDEFRRIEKTIGLKREELLQWFESRPKYIEEDDFIAVHAGVHPWQDKMQEQDVENLYYTRFWDVEKRLSYRFYPKDAKSVILLPWYQILHKSSYNGKKIFFGHWAKKGLVQEGQVWGLDTGCCYGGKLTALLYPAMEVVQVDSRQPKLFDY